MPDIVPIGIDAFPPEERDKVLQLGKISRPFAHDPRESRLRRTINLYRALTLAKVWDVVGCDVSVWQGNIDWPILSEYVDFTYIRYGYGNDYKDPTASVNAKGALDNNVIYDGYWYQTMKSWNKMATNFYAVRSELGGQMYPDFDLEETGGLNKSDLANWMYHGVSYYCQLDKREITDTLLYTSNGFYNSYVEPGILKPMELHIALWSNIDEPYVPKDWQNKGWLFWQDKIIELPGVTSKIDHDVCKLTRAEFENRFHVKLPPKNPPVAPRRIRVNTASLNIRVLPNDDAGTYVVGTTTLGKEWNTTGVQSQDAKGRGWWYQVADDHGQVAWVAGWLCLSI